MALYLIIAIGVCSYNINSRSINLGGCIVAGLTWPVTLILYLFTMVTGRSARNPITGMTNRPGGRCRGQQGGQGRGGRY